MTEREKLLQGQPFDVRDPEINVGKLHAFLGCRQLEEISVTKSREREAVIRELFGAVGENPVIMPGFHCENGQNISVGDEFMANYHVIILDVSPVTIGHHVWIGPNTLITTLNHPLSPSLRRAHQGVSKPIVIGDDV